MNKWTKDVAFGMFMIGIGAFVLAGARRFPTISAEAMGSGLGPGFYPRVAAIVLIMISIAVVGRAVLNMLRQRSEINKTASDVNEPESRSRYRIPIAILVLLIAYAAIITKLGFCVSTFLFVSAAIAILSPAGLRRGWKALGVILSVAAIATFAVYGLFSYVAKVPLPMLTILTR